MVKISSRAQWAVQLALLGCNIELYESVFLRRFDALSLRLSEDHEKPAFVVLGLKYAYKVHRTMPWRRQWVNTAS